MKFHNPIINEEYLKYPQVAATPIKIDKVHAKSNGSLFFNTFWGSKIEEDASVALN